VFPSRRGTPMEPDNLRRSWYAIRKDAGLGQTRFHDLRHTRVTLLLDLGAPGGCICCPSPRISDPGSAARAPVHVQTAGQTAGQISWSDLPRRLILPVKRYLDVTGRSRGARRTGHRTGAPHSHRSRLGRRTAPQTRTEQPALRPKEISGQGTQKGTARA
jgi:hypothetical protein